MRVINVLSWNAHGWRETYHLPQTQQLFDQYDILFIAESWTRHAYTPLLTPPNFVTKFTSYPEPPQGRISGGLILYHRTNLPVKIIHYNPISWKPIIWIEVGDLLLCGAYLPHENSNFLAHWELDPVEELLTMATRYKLSPPALPPPHPLQTRGTVPRPWHWHTRRP